MPSPCTCVFLGALPGLGLAVFFDRLLFLAFGLAADSFFFGFYCSAGFGASDFFSAVAYAASGLINADAVRFALVVGPVYAFGVWFGASLFGRASEAHFRAICYALIAAAVIIGLPALDGLLRGS